MWGAAQLSPRALWITAGWHRGGHRGWRWQWLPYRTALPQGRGKAKRERASPEHGVGRRHRYGAVGRQGRDSTEGFGVGCQRTLGGAAEALGASGSGGQGPRAPKEDRGGTDLERGSG
jgi:hypothetical protein